MLGGGEGVGGEVLYPILDWTLKILTLSQTCYFYNCITISAFNEKAPVNNAATVILFPFREG